VNDSEPGLAEAFGCYVFAMRAGKGFTPWYVGKTDKAFRDECLAPHKLNYYNQVNVSHARGTPVLFLLPKITGERREFARRRTPSASAGSKDIEFLEQYLVALALNKNRDLRNARGTRFLRDMVVSGILNSPGRPSGSATALRRCLGL